MAKGKKRLEERVAEQVKKLLPDGLVPDSYLNYVVLDNADISDTEEELLGNVKMQMYEETGYDIPMTRKEAEELAKDYELTLAKNLTPYEPFCAYDLWDIFEVDSNKLIPNFKNGFYELVR